MDPDIREALERAAGFNRTERACIEVQATGDEAIARKAWFGTGSHPRTSPPDWTPDDLRRADAMVRAALDAKPGSLHRVRDGSVYRYMRGPKPSNVEVI